MSTGVGPGTDPHADAVVRIAGDPQASGPALLLIHGRGAAAEGMLELGGHLARGLEAAGGVPVLMAPQAVGSSWYPGSFLEPLERNQPWLDSALAVVARCVADLEARGIEPGRQVLVGFSQGACLACEYAARHPRRWGGLLAFTGGIQGPLDEGRTFEGDLAGTPMLLSTGDPDPHVPLQRVEETARLFREMGADVTSRVYPGRPHTILGEELRAGVEVLTR